MSIKQGRNDKCKCGSGKKYKFCCFANDEKKAREEEDKFYEGHETISLNIAKCIVAFLEKYPTFKIIDISDYLTNETYKKFQMINMKLNTIMIAERNTNNEAVFLKHIPEDMPKDVEINMILMFRGSYRLFHSKDLEKYMASLEEMITNRLNNLVETPKLKPQSKTRKSKIKMIAKKPPTANTV